MQSFRAQLRFILHVCVSPQIFSYSRVTVAKAKIQANPEMFYKSGSDINLTCTSEIVSRAPPSFIYWYKDGDLMNYSQRGGINVLTEQQTARSTLLISKATASDSGNYTCFPSNTSKHKRRNRVNICVCVR